MFQAVLFTVIAYLVACYAYGIYLLWKLYADRRLHGSHSENPADGADQPATASVTHDAPRRVYDVPAKAA